MDKGSLRMRTQAHSQHKKKHLTLHQQTFLAVKENRVPEVFIIDEIEINNLNSYRSYFYYVQLRH